MSIWDIPILTFAYVFFRALFNSFTLRERGYRLHSGERGLGFYDEALQGVYQGRELRADVQMVWDPQRMTPLVLATTRSTPQTLHVKPLTP